MVKPNRASQRKLPADLTEDALRRLWCRARKGNVDAQRQLNALVSANPHTVPQTIRRFVIERESHLKSVFGEPKPPEKPLSAWQRSVGAAGRYVVWTQGGLPTLGKRR